MDQFGHGVVVPLVLFTEHFNNRWAMLVEEAIQWKNMTPSERLPLVQSVDSGGTQWALLVHRLEREDIEDIISHNIRMWCYGAGDHLIGIDKRKAPKSLVLLAKLVTDIRFRKVVEPLGEATWNRIKVFWREAAMDIDELLVKTNPQWEDLAGEGGDAS